MVTDKFKKLISKMKIVKKDNPGDEAQAGYRKKSAAKGIKKLKDDEDLYKAFGIDELPEEKTVIKKTKKKKLTIKPREKYKKKFTKNGIQILKGNEDLISEMSVNSGGKNNTELVKEGCLSEFEKKKNIEKNKHGVRVIDSDCDYKDYFNDNIIDNGFGAGESFEELLDKYLSNKSHEVLLKEKKDSFKVKKKISLKKRLKLYPRPQGLLDLHGYNSIKAALITEQWLRTEFNKGTYTLRIITGKGIHSEMGAVLPDVVLGILESLKKEKIVFNWEWEKKKIKKSGYVTVYLEPIS